MLPLGEVAAELNAGDTVYIFLTYIVQGTDHGFNSDVEDSFSVNFPANGFDMLRAWVWAYDENQTLLNDLGVLTNNYNQLIDNPIINVTQNNRLSVPLQFISGNVNIDDNINQPIKQKRLELYPNPA